ncbi:MAG: hypothetical protein CMJ33_09060 [Phycisphaerae bacterium]|nr:hypothetical protein [Phycisphaerae bacterium]
MNFRTIITLLALTVLASCSETKPEKGEDFPEVDQKTSPLDSITDSREDVAIEDEEESYADDETAPPNAQEPGSLGQVESTDDDVTIFFTIHDFCASEVVNVDGINEFLELGSDVDSQNENGETPLHVLVKNPNADWESMKLLLRMGGDVNAKDESGKTVLMLAIEKGLEIGTIVDFIRSGADIDIADGSGRSAIHFAATMRDTAYLDNMIQAGANADAQQLDGRTPLHNAIISKNLPATVLLINAGANLESLDGQRRTPLAWACKLGLADEASILIESNADVRTRDIDGNDPMAFALSAPDPACVSLLMTSGVDIDSRDASETGNSSYIDVALQNDDSVAAQRLVDFGADMHQRDEEGRTPLIRAVMENRQRVTATLSEQKDLLDSRDNNGETALHHAVLKKDENAVRTLLRAGANPDIRDGIGMTPLHHALKRPFDPITEILIDTGADLGLSDQDGLSPLVTGIQNKNYQACALMFDSGADINKQDANGTTPLMHAVKAGASKRMVSMLVSRGVDLESTDMQSYTALHHLAEELARPLNSLKSELHDAVQWKKSRGGNGHYYAIRKFRRGTPMRLVRKAAHESGGYMGTIQSKAENNFILDNLIGDEYAREGYVYLGALRGNDGRWRWLNGEPFKYTNWTDESPSGFPECVPAMLGPNNGGYTQGGKWNDLDDLGRYCNRWLIEWDGSSTDIANAFECLRLLVDAGADPYAKNQEGKTAMAMLDASRKSLPAESARELTKTLADLKRSHSEANR